MAEFFDEFESLHEMQPEIEAAIHAAGAYVRASDDLRPRVLESARIERHEWQVQLVIRHTAILVVLFASLMSAFRSPPNSSVDLQSWNWLAASSDSLLIPTRATAIHGGDLAWQLVESFTELRRRQATALHETP